MFEPDAISVQLHKTGASFGIHFIGPNDENTMAGPLFVILIRKSRILGIFITNVSPGTAAAECGLLKRGMQVIWRSSIIFVTHARFCR